MAHTRGPVHLSLEDKTFPRKEWPKGYCSEIPPAPHGMMAAPGRLNEIYHQQETRCPVLGRTCQQSYLLLLPDLFPKHLSDIFSPYWALFLSLFLFLSFIPQLSLLYFVLLILPAFAYVSWFGSSYYFIYLETFYFLPVFQRTFTAGPICFP